MYSTQLGAADAGAKRDWPADKVERWPIDRLITYANNARLHTAADVNKIAASIRQWGWTMPVLADEDGVLIAGHARVRAAAKLGLTSIPVIVARSWSEEEKRAYRVANNQLAARGSWDTEQLSKELGELKFDKFDLDLIGFEPDQLDKILGGLGPSGRSDPDSVPELPEEPVSQLGDVWLLGDHRVGCGDSTSAADVARMLSGSRPHLMVTDPPYGVSYDPSWRACRQQSSGNLARGKVLNDDRANWREAYALFPGDVAYVWFGALRGDVAAADLAACGFQLRAQIVWAKQHFTLSRGDYHWKHETCWYAVRDGKTSHWQGGRKQTTVWEIPNNNPFGNGQREECSGHGTQKPVECMRRAIANNSRPGEAIYDPFLGSGTGLVAAEMSGRNCYGLELSIRPMSMSSYGAGSASPGAKPSIKPPANVSTDAPAASTAITEHPKMTRKAFLVDEAMREKVRYLAGVGVRQDDIAQIIGCAPKTLRKRFRAELDRGVAEANAAVCGYLFAAAKAGNISAIIFWLKTRAHWREGAMPDAPSPRAEAEENSQVLLVLPDNSRDPGLTQVLQEAQQDYFARTSRRSVTGTQDSEDGPGVPTDALADAAFTLRSGGDGQTAFAAGI